MKETFKAAFTGKAAIATWIGIALFIAIGVLVIKTRKDPFSWEAKPAPAITK